MSSIRRGACVAALLAWAMLPACDKKKEAAAPASTGMPPLDQPAANAPPMPANHPTHPPTAGADETGQLPPVHPPIAQGGAAPSGGFEGATPGGELDPKTVVAGVIKLDAKIKDKVASGDTIFVVARRYEEGSTAPGTML